MSLTRRSAGPDISCKGLLSEKASKLGIPKRVWVRCSCLLGASFLEIGDGLLRSLEALWAIWEDLLKAPHSLVNDVE